MINYETVYHIGASLKDLGKKPVVSEVESMVRFLKNQPRCRRNRKKIRKKLKTIENGALAACPARRGNSEHRNNRKR